MEKKKIKTDRIVFNKGEDDGKKGVSEQMKKSFDQFMQEHTPDLTEEQLNELVAELQEVLGKDDPAGKWISDFVHSDNPKFAGKSKEKRKQMALAAYYAKQRNEEVEEIDELSKSTLGSYIKKSAMEYGRDKQLVGRESPSGMVKDARPEVRHKLKKRAAGIAKATDRLTKEEAEIEEGNNTQKKFTVVHYSPKTDRNVTKKIRANSESEVWDKLKAKGINPVSVKEEHATEQTNEALRLSPEAGKKLSAAVASAAKGGKVHFQSTSVGKDGKKTTEHGYTDSEGNRVVTKVVKEEEHMDEALKGNQHKIDKNKNGKIDAHDFKLLRKEEADEIDEAQSHQAKTTMKHIDNPTAGEKKAAKDIKPGIAGFRDRIAMLKSAQARGALKKEEAEQVDEAVSSSDAKTTAERLVKKTIATHGITNPRTASDHAKNAHAIEKTLDRASVARSPIHLANAHSDVKTVSAATRRHNVAQNMSGAERKAHKTLQAGVVKHLQQHLDQHKQAFQNAAAKYASKNKTNEEVEQMDEMWPGTPEYKKKFPDTERTTGRGERHDIQKTSSGVKATRRYSSDDTTEKPANAPKRGRGRPKKDKFAEAVDFLMSVNEDQFEELIAEGFDAFFAAYERAVTK
jgi:hypothetical protein